jgi:hypothetical protein
MGRAGEIAMNDPARAAAAIRARRRGVGAANIVALEGGFCGVGGGGEHLPEEGDALRIGVKGVGGQAGHDGLP